MAGEARQISASRVTNKTMELTKAFGRYVFDHPEFLESLPDKAILVFLDPDGQVFNGEVLAKAEK